ncbi:MAG: PEP-CTERM sorting domain-containing protein [Gemmatimonadaceae bacterium]
MRKILKVVSATVAAGMIALPSAASAQTWANWTTASTPGGTMSGTIGATTIAYSGGMDGYQLSDGTTRTAGVTSSPNCNYAFFCLPAAYTSAGVAGPTNNGFIQYTAVHTGTITFGSAVTNPLISFISVGNGGATVHYDFGANGFALLSSNTGAGNQAAWGSGTNSIAGNIITGNEFSGTIRLNGTFTSFTYSILDNENWHGLTVGRDDVGANAVVPEPSTYALMGAGLLAVAVAARRRRKA